jgi:hypothetical protein
MERVMRIELTYDFRLLAWKASALPMDHTRIICLVPLLGNDPSQPVATVLQTALRP